jgi:hypothetical protein
MQSSTRHEDLCETCQNIDLRPLLQENRSTPVFNSDIEMKWLSTRETGQRVPGSYDLGSFIQIENRSRECEMCRFIARILRRRGLFPQHLSKSYDALHYCLDMTWFVEVVSDSYAK